jgi:hypothetical protein
MEFPCLRPHEAPAADGGADPLTLSAAECAARLSFQWPGHGSRRILDLVHFDWKVGRLKKKEISRHIVVSLFRPMGEKSE